MTKLFARGLIALFCCLVIPTLSLADSVNSPNITMNVDTNRATGAGAGNVAITINTITIAETTLPEYSSGGTKAITIKVRPGYQFVSSSNVTAQSATIGINGAAVNVAAAVTPTGAADEVITFNLTSGTSTTVQDIIRINGIKLKILSAAGAAGPAQTTMAVTTSTAGGAFTNQGIVAANITKGVADHLVFSKQPGNNQAGQDLLPEVKIVDFGGNIITTESRVIVLSLQANPGNTNLLGTTQRSTNSGVATWVDADNLNLTAAADGYVLQATQVGGVLQTSDSVSSGAFNITAGVAGSLVISTQPTDTTAGGDILINVTAVDEFNNPITATNVDITLDSAINPGGWPLLVDTNLTKTTVNGIASWGASDHLRINKVVSDYQLSASGVGAPVVTNAFDITPGTANSLRFVQQPSDVLEDVVMSPPVTVEVIDQFANRIDSAAEVALSLPTNGCGGTITGATATAVSGIATFSALAFDTPCSATTLLGSLTGIAGVSSDEFDIRAKDAVPIAVKAMELKRGKLFKFSSKGSFSISKDKNDDPTKKGATLTVTGTTGTVKYSLPKGGWKKVGSNGFQFKGSKCESVVVKKSTISATCKSRTGTITIPEVGPVAVDLKLGKGTARFCGECGGTIKGDENKVFKRSSCEAPEACQ